MIGDGINLFGLGHRGDVKFSPARKISLGFPSSLSLAPTLSGLGNHARSSEKRPAQAITTNIYSLSLYDNSL